MTQAQSTQPQDTLADVVLRTLARKAQGLTGAGSQVFSQNSAGLPGVAEAHDRFGATVSFLPATATDRAQAAVGDPAENAARRPA